jgi:hypothetical protein
MHRPARVPRGRLGVGPSGPNRPGCLRRRETHLDVEMQRLGAFRRRGRPIGAPRASAEDRPAPEPSQAHSVDAHRTTRRGTTSARAARQHRPQPTRPQPRRQHVPLVTLGHRHHVDHRVDLDRAVDVREVLADVRRPLPAWNAADDRPRPDARPTRIPVGALQNRSTSRPTCRAGRQPLWPTDHMNTPAPGTTPTTPVPGSRRVAAGPAPRGAQPYLTVSVPCMPASRWPGTEQ